MVIKIFDLSKILKEIKDAIQVVDGPDDLSLDLLIKGVGTSGGADAVDLGIPDMSDKDSMKKLMKTAGLSEKDADFDIEKIDGGLRYRFSSKAAKQKGSEQMKNLFQGDMLEKLIEGLMGTFGNLGTSLEEGLGQLKDESDEK